MGAGRDFYPLRTALRAPWRDLPLFPTAFGCFDLVIVPRLHRIPGVDKPAENIPDVIQDTSFQTA